MEARAERSNDPTGETVDPRTSLALWLRAGRAQRKLTLDDVARVTKIQPRILEKLEAGCFDGLPAEVFVRGFVRSVARCVGLDEQEALERYGACAGLAPVARALVATMSELAPTTARMIVADEPTRLPASTPSLPAPVVVEEPPAPAVVEVVEEAAPVVVESVVEVVEAAPVEAPSKKKRSRKKANGTTPPRTRKKKLAEPEPVVVAAVEPEPVVAAVEPEPVVAAVEPEPVAETPAIEVIDMSAEGPMWRPTMPPIPASPPVPWRRPAFTAPPSYVVPTLVIDDADPESADLEREARDAAKQPSRVSFLPPILLERDDKSGRQGGLTLAVIILLIAATLTLSYLMRRPSLSGDGVTMSDAIAHRLA